MSRDRAAVDAPPRDWIEHDYYACLGVAADASDREITRAYRNLAKAHHPDAGDGSDAQRFSEVATAYEVLRDPATRARYDEVRRLVAAGAFSGPGTPGGSGFPSGFAPSGPGFSSFGFTGFDFGGPQDGEDLFAGLFTRGPRPRRGRDVAARARVDFRAALTGTTVSVRVPTICEACNGTGNACTRCDGFGQQAPRELSVRIPAGVTDGAQVRVRLQGFPGQGGGPPGDLVILMSVTPDAQFSRRGARDLAVTVPISFTEAALGAQVPVPTLDGPVRVKLAPGTPTGAVQRLRGKGVTLEGAAPGDLLVTFVVDVPVAPTEAQRAALEHLASVLPPPLR